MEKEISGVSNVPAAEEQEDWKDVDLNTYFEEEDLGDEATTDAESGGVEGEDDGPGDAFQDDRVEKAFARRLAAKEAQIRQEMEQKYTQQQISGYPPVVPQVPGQTQPQAPAPQQQLPSRLTSEQLSHLADKFATTPELVEVMYNQQLVINQQGEFMRNVQGLMGQMEDNSQKAATIAGVESQRRVNPALPEFDENRAAQIRQQYLQQLGVILPWGAAYRQMVAEDTITGKLSRQAEQQTIKKIVKRGKSSVEKPGVKSASRPDVWDLSDDQFERMLDNAKQGKYKKS